MGFMATGGPAVRGHAWNLLSVSRHHSFVATVRGVVPAAPLICQEGGKHGEPQVGSSVPLFYSLFHWRAEEEASQERIGAWQWHLTSENLPVGDVDAADVGEGEGRRH